ncbi:GDP-mannose 4,6-dehydratase [Paenibacillus sp. UMB4589-SE434]|uniref:GDP-mannose 4,6-dehydratase n=1 Tax=Paenibacillus sp. UMB4589-SE434 TaxID=3046314 RepID=UPI00255084A7|nr:GDP-mannose 4,6-dehydratase [Paenibacillus sp. UMB4589-SE434]MDK8181676.1 GDP-mannose 4,6-dehydratase [Paenibacillus sp. UMB4589-SE434]
MITGGTGFVGRHLANYINSLNDGHQIWCTYANEVPHINSSFNYIRMPLGDPLTIKKVIKDVMPDIVFHLAGQSNVHKSWENKIGTFEVNLNGTIFLLDAIKEIVPYSVIVTIGSSEEYGLKNTEDMPLVESSTLTPTNPYGLSKMAMGMISQQYNKAYGLKTIHVRPFNHIGPGQSSGFVVPDLINQIVSIESALDKDPIIYTGNLSSIRDFTDVRDIVKAYWLLAISEISGEVYNVSSGIGRSVENLLDIMISYSTREITVRKDLKRYRPLDNPIYIGDNNKLINHTGWGTQIDIHKTIRDVMIERRTLVKQEKIAND